MSLEGKVLLVTGGGRGIGRAIALVAAEAGADVAVAVSRDVAAAEAVAGEVRSMGRKAAAYQTDVADPAACEKLIASTIADLGRLDVLVNNAGITRDGLVIRMSDADWDAVLDTNLKGAFNCSRSALKRMLRQKSGRIINITSVVGLTGNAGQVNYSASKAGMIGLTKALAREAAPRGITCNAIAPGWIETRMTEGLPESLQADWKGKIPLGRFGLPEDVAEAVVFLASDRAAYITGQVLAVDGGMTC